MLVKELKRFLQGKKDDESIVFFCNGYSQPVMTFEFDFVHGDYIIISHRDSIKPSVEDILDEDSSLRNDEALVSLLENLYK